MCSRYSIQEITLQYTRHKKIKDRVPGYGIRQNTVIRSGALTWIAWTSGGGGGVSLANRLDMVAAMRWSERRLERPDQSGRGSGPRVIQGNGWKRIFSWASSGEMYAKGVCRVEMERFV